MEEAKPALPSAYQPEISVGIYTPGNREKWLEVARSAFQGGFFPKHVTSAEKALYLMHRGILLGMDPFVFMENTYLVEGRLYQGINQCMAVLAAKGIKWVQKELTQEKCTLEMHREGWPTHTEVYDLADAQRSGLANKATFRQHPKRMLRANCFRAAAQAVASDLLLGMLPLDELETAPEASQDAEVVAETPVEPKKPVKGKSEQKPQVPADAGQAKAEAEEPKGHGTVVIPEVAVEKKDVFDPTNTEHRKMVVSALNELEIPGKWRNENNEKLKAELVKLKVMASPAILKEFVAEFHKGSV